MSDEPTSEPADDRGYVVLMTAVGSDEAARTLSRSLVEDGLVACAQRLPIRSCYRWRGELVEEDETLVLLKTRRACWPELSEAVRSRHPYEVPEIIELPVTRGWPAYLDWIDEQTAPSGWGG